MNTSTIINIDSIIGELRDEIQNLKPRYKVYTALMSQSNSDNPVVKVLHNTLGNIVWTRDQEGIYIGTLSGRFTHNKTVCFATPGSYDGNSVGEINMCTVDVNTVQITVYDTSGGNTDFLTGGAFEVSIEIKVYY